MDTLPPCENQTHPISVHWKFRFRHHRSYAVKWWWGRDLTSTRHPERCVIRLDGLHTFCWNSKGREWRDPVVVTMMYSVVHHRLARGMWSNMGGDSCRVVLIFVPYVCKAASKAILGMKFSVNKSKGRQPVKCKTKNQNTTTSKRNDVPILDGCEQTLHRKC